MNISKYYWDLSDKALRETEGILKNSRHVKFVPRMMTLLSRCDDVKEFFRIVDRRTFVRIWPSIRTYWIKRARVSDFRDWWETIYEQLAAGGRADKKQISGSAAVFLRELGRKIREARIKEGLSQRHLALRSGMKQPDISKVEEGKKNMTLFTLVRLLKILNIKRIEL